MGRHRPKPWRVVVLPHAWRQAGQAPREVKERVTVHILHKLVFRPLPKDRALRRGTRAHGVVDPIRSGQGKNRKVQHIRLVGLWRLNYVVLSRWREVYVCECVEHLRGSNLYTDEHIQQLLDSVRGFRPNPRG